MQTTTCVYLVTFLGHWPWPITSIFDLDVSGMYISILKNRCIPETKSVRQKIQKLHPNRTHENFVCSCDLDFDRMTLIHELDTDIQVLYTCVLKWSFLGQGFQKLEPKEDRQTDGQTRLKILPGHICEWLLRANELLLRMFMRLKTFALSYKLVKMLCVSLCVCLGVNQGGTNRNRYTQRLVMLDAQI